MKKKTFVFLFLLFSPLSNIAQNLIYSGSINNFTDANVMDMEKTSKGELIIAVDYPGARHIKYGQDTYFGLYKIDNNGNIDWRFKYNNDIFEYVFWDIALDETDNIYAMLDIIGSREYIINGLKFSPGLNFTKISSDGEIIWNKVIGESAREDYGEVGNACIKYKNGKIYVMGTYTGSLNLDDQFYFNSKEYYQCYMWMYFPGSDYFVAKYDTNGNLINAVSLGEDYPDNLISMEIDNSENIYFTGVSDNFPCVHSYQHITKLDSCLNLQWIKRLSYNYDSPRYAPMNIHYSKNDKIYLWNISIDNINHGIWVTDNKNPCLMEIDPLDGNVLRTLNINANLSTRSYVDYRRHYPNGFIDDFGNDLIIHSAFLDSLIIDNDTIWSKGYQTLCLLKIDLENFSVSLIKTIEGKREQYFVDMPGKLIADEPYIYFSGDYGENPLDVFGTLLYNRGTNIFDEDVFYCKIDMTPYFTDLEGNINQLMQNKVLVFPNPVSDILYIQSELKINKLTIFSIDGKIIFSGTNTNSVDVSKLSNGIYIVNILTNNGIDISKFLVKH